ncbi:hypothetical protein ACGFNP_49230 [Nonomuraea sp. NPDC049269]|uniref:hypothetical protein n=1 Tax=Nonomuraea sp. NPDC049269 TaxID=3364349 RepID=UPI003715D9D6
MRAQVAGLGAQAAVRAIARVAGAYANRRASKKRGHIFRPHGAVPYDARLMSWNRDARTVSLWTPTGRVTVPYAGRPEDLKAIDTLPMGEADLICRRGVWLLQVTLTLPKPAVREPVGGFVGGWIKGWRTWRSPATAQHCLVPPWLDQSAATATSARCGSGGTGNAAACRRRERRRRGECCAACPGVSTG